MIKLYGIAISNFYNTAKLALVEKGLEFEEVKVMPSQEPDVLANNPTGKVPWIEVDGKALSEVNVIFDYLEDTHPEPALYPADPWQRAKNKEVSRLFEQYLDSPARKHLPTVYFGAPVDDHAYKHARPEIEKGLRALRAAAAFGPYIAGDTYTFADINAYFHLGFVNMHTTRIYDWDISKDVPQITDYMAMLRERPAVAAVASVAEAALAAFQNK